MRSWLAGWRGWPLEFGRGRGQGREPGLLRACARPTGDRCYTMQAIGPRWVPWFVLVSALHAHVLLAAAAAGPVPGARPADPVGGVRWQQPRLMLSLWYDPVVPVADFRKRYQEIADANCTAIMGGFGCVEAPPPLPKGPACVEAQLAAAVAAGVGLVAAGRVGISGYGGSPALWGYQLKDEPNAGEFPALANLTASIAVSQPGKLRFINLLPNCDPTTCLNTSSYPAYVSQFVETVRPDVLCMDAYPNFVNAPNASGPSREAYIFALSVLRVNALKDALNFWNFFGTQHVFQDEPDPSEAQIRWQAFTSLAMGSKGLLYYCWHGGVEFPGGVLAPLSPLDDFPKGELALTDHHEHIQRINTHILAWESYLLNATSVGYWRIAAAAAPQPFGTPGNVASLPRAGTSCASGSNPSGCVTWQQAKPGFSDVRNWLNMGPPTGLPFLLGQFLLADGRTALMLQNQDDRFTAIPNVTIAPHLAEMHCCQVSPRDGRERAAIFGFPWGRIDPGSASLFVFSDTLCPV